MIERPALLALALAACVRSAAPRASDPCAGTGPASVVCGFYQAHLEVRPFGLPTPE